jgi:hypothetical protein
LKLPELNPSRLQNEPSFLAFLSEVWSKVNAFSRGVPWDHDGGYRAWLEMEHFDFEILCDLSNDEVGELVRSDTENNQAGLLSQEQIESGENRRMNDYLALQKSEGSGEIKPIQHFES